MLHLVMQRCAHACIIQIVNRCHVVYLYVNANYISTLVLTDASLIIDHYLIHVINELGILNSDSLNTKTVGGLISTPRALLFKQLAKAI